MGMTADEHATLVDGVPPWMQEDMKRWLAIAVYASDGATPEKDLALVMDFDRRARSAKPLATDFRRSFSTLEASLYYDDDLYIRFLDFLVWQKSQQIDRNRPLLDALGAILESSGSRWKVGTRLGVHGLEQRVPEGVQDVASAAMNAPGHAGQLLSEAWHAAFGVHPNPVAAYTNAVLAVEAASVPVVIPTDPAATLGKVFTVMRDQKDWGLEIAKQHKDHPTSAVLLRMIQMLWAGQGRHAGQPDWAPNTVAEAEVAVMLAVPLVQWFTSGAIARRP